MEEPPVTVAAKAESRLPVAAACALAAAAAAASAPGPSGGSPEERPGPAAERRSRSPQRRLEGETQRGEASAALGHSLREVGPYAFCCRCGAFTKLQGADRAKGLKQQCGGRIPQGAQVTAGQRKKRLYLNRLLCRSDPYTGKPLA